MIDNKEPGQDLIIILPTATKCLSLEWANVHAIDKILIYVRMYRFQRELWAHASGASLQRPPPPLI